MKEESRLLFLKTPDSDLLLLQKSLEATDSDLALVAEALEAVVDSAAEEVVYLHLVVVVVVPVPHLTLAVVTNQANRTSSLETLHSRHPRDLRETASALRCSLVVMLLHRLHLLEWVCLVIDSVYYQV